MMNWWWTEDELMMNWWWVDDKLMMNRWWTDDELMMNWSGLPKTITDYHRLPLTDWFYSIEHSKLYPGLDGMDGIYISLTPPTTRAPLAVLITKKTFANATTKWQVEKGQLPPNCKNFIGNQWENCDKNSSELLSENHTDGSVTYWQSLVHSNSALSQFNFQWALPSYVS